MIQQQSVQSVLTSLLATIRETHNPVLIRMLLSNLLYIHSMEAHHEVPLPMDDYVQICMSLHSYIQGEYRSSPACVLSTPSQGFLHVVLISTRLTTRRVHSIMI